MTHTHEHAAAPTAAKTTNQRKKKTRSLSIKTKDKLSIVTSLGTMLSAGIPLQEAVDGLHAESKDNNRKLLMLFKESLNEGRPLSDAMTRAPRVFDPVTTNLIRAAEESGTLDLALKKAALQIKKDTEFRENIKSSLTYPVFVIGIFFAVLGLILTFVIPRVSSVFSGLRMELPAATKFLINASNLLLGYYWVLLIALTLAICSITVLYRNNKRALFNAFLSMPGLRTLGLQIDITRLTGGLSSMLSAGIPISEALELSKKSVTKKSMQRTVEFMHSGVLEGLPLSAGLRRNPEIPQLMIKMTETAEKSGTLESMMQELSEYYENEVAHTLKTITSLIEPIMIVVIGVMVGSMMLAVIAPMYNMITQIRVR